MVYKKDFAIVFEKFGEVFKILKTYPEDVYDSEFDKAVDYLVKNSCDNIEMFVGPDSWNKANEYISSVAVDSAES